MTLYSFEGRTPILPAPDSEGPGYWVAENAVILGDVTLKKNSSIWFGAVLRGDNERITIGEDSNIQENAVLHTDPGAPLSIGRGVTVGHLAMLHGCEIGDGSLIGIGAIILNHAKVGRQCLIGAGALVASGKVIPDYSMVLGSPGKVVRELTGEERAGLAVSADSYASRWRRFAKGLKPMVQNG